MNRIINRVLPVIMFAGILALTFLTTAFLTTAQEGSGDETPVATALPPDVTPTAVPKPQPIQVIEQNGITLELYFDEIEQGRAGLLHVFGDDLIGAHLRFQDKITDFFPIEGDGFYGLIAIGMDQPARDYDLSVFAIYSDDNRETFDTQVTVTLGGFIGQNFDLP
ncbi:MAG TPA: hypothetical protein VHL11_02225, partial [Phototrophicaceae bacterium]|nr:hypothetical protein [Phototrophicaceae bacterium]